MNYYDELGLGPDAADEDIRRAHRILSKVLHPDRQTDPAARDAAELQMRRINVLVETLLDPQRRHEYDSSQRPASFPVGSGQVNRRDVPARRWRFGGPASVLLLTMTAAVALTGAAIWFLGADLVQFQTSGNRPPIPLPKPASSAPRHPARVVEGGRVRMETRSREALPIAVSVRPPRPSHQRVAPGRTAAFPGERVPAGSPIALPTATTPEAQPTIAGQPEAVPTASIPGSPLAGWWLYAPDVGKTAATTALYAPEYIQLQIHIDNGAVQGTYSARYRVPDRPISREVAFHFEGKSDGGRSFPWQSDDGSLGVVDLKLLSVESLQVSWRVRHFGTRLGLGAGTAVLIRKIDP